ncbi:prepilin peptidase [Lactiplantibacillus plantarum]|nr:prepilin peptidase [Lactiplantibacillus plantarum]
MLTSSLFIIGLCLGSFVTCMAERISSGHILISTQRSRCPHCRHQLRFWQLIPLLGILLQRGQCYDCRTPISLRSSLIELLCGGLLVSSSASLSLTLPLLISYLVLIFNSLTDYLTFEVYPLTLLLPADTLLACLAIAAVAALVGFIISAPRHRLPFVPFISWSFIMVTQLTGLA